MAGEPLYSSCPAWFHRRMKHLLVWLGLLGVALAVRAESIQGTIEVPYSPLSTNRFALTKASGTEVKATWSCRAGEFYGWEALFAQLTLTNTGSRPMWGQCCLVFYDRDKRVVGSVAQAFTSRRGLKPRSARSLNPGRIILPQDRYKDIVAYEAVIFETGAPSAKKKDSILLEDP